MKNISILCFLVFFTFSQVYAEEVKLSPEEQIEKKIQEQVDSGLGTIKVFISERGECKKILSHKTIQTWYMGFVDDIAKPIENRKLIFERQNAPFQEEINTIKKSIDEKRKNIEEKKASLSNDYEVLTSGETILSEIKTLLSQIDGEKLKLVEKTQALNSILTEYDKHAKTTREDIIKSYQRKILTHCQSWYGKIELSDKKTLDQIKSDTTTNVITPQIKYRKELDQISLDYVTNPEKVKSLGKRLSVTLRKLSKDHKSYALLQAMKKHIDTLK